MVSVVPPVLALVLPPPPLPLSLPPQAATPNARAVTRQPEAASERTRKFPSSRKAIPNGHANLAKSQDIAQRATCEAGDQVRRFPGKYGASMRAVTPSSTTST